MSETQRHTERPRIGTLPIEQMTVLVDMSPSVRSCGDMVMVRCVSVDISNYGDISIPLAGQVEPMLAARLGRMEACVNALAGIPDPAEFVRKANQAIAERDAAVRERDALLRDLWRKSCQSWMRFWLCLKCQHVGTGQRGPHACKKCGNQPRDGYFTEATFAQWEAQNEDDFQIWRAEKMKSLAALSTQPEGEKKQEGGAQ